jgi:hypothetical protein
MKTRRLALILLILGGVLVLGEVRLSDSSGMRGRKSLSRPDWVVPAKQGPESRPMKFVDPPMRPVPPGQPTLERDRPRR